MDNLQMIPVGHVFNGEWDHARNEWGAVISEIKLRAGLGEALLGLDGYSHVMIVGWLDRVPQELRGRVQAYPAGDAQFPLQGALALRGGARPNPVSITVCRLLDVEGDSLRVKGLDLIDGTPVLDVKPYVPFYDSVTDAVIPDWATGR